MMPDFIRFAPIWLALAAVSLPAADPADPSRAGTEFFENKIRPVLINRCIKCHGREKQEGKLRLDRRDSLLAGGRSGRVVLPGDPGGSLLIRAIRRVNKDLQMPPEDAEQLTADEVQNFVAWVKLGAPYPSDSGAAPAFKPALDLAKARQFWSLRPVEKPTPPPVEPSSWPRNPIDQFVLAKLNAAKLPPSPPADKPALLRRATYTLTGLPPTPEEIDGFLSDESPGAFAKVVERLLQSRQYGVHWARHWFDVARYGDTRWVGAGEDKRWPFAYTYRDWVINALNEDLRYDRFVTLQLAADQYFHARPADQAALGFLTVGRWFTGTLPDVIDDQIDVVTRGLLGVSVQCARCHDHKYDPVSTQDYYSLYGLFAAARLPVDGAGTLAALPVIAPHPAEARTEREIAALRAPIEEFLTTRVTALRNEFRAPEKLQQYLLAATGQLEKKDKEIRAFAKAQNLDERIFQRWVRYLKNTARNPHPIFAPWHALAALPEAEFATRAAAVLEKERASKLNRHVTPLLTPVPKSLAELAAGYVALFTKFDATETAGDVEQEALRQVLRGNDSPVQVPVNELSQFLSTDEMKRLVELRRTLLGKLASLPERADLFLTYQHEAAPLVTEINEFLQQRKTALATELRSPEKIAAYLLAAREAEATSDSKFKSLAKSKQLSERGLRRWMDFLQRLSPPQERVFAAWRVFAAVADKDFTNQVAQVTERARKASGNAVVTSAFATPPASLAEVAKRYGELLVRSQTEPFPDAGHIAIRLVVSAADSPLRVAPEDVVDYLTQKDLDELRNKERKLARLYLESPGVAPRAMSLSESGRGYAQRVFVRGNPNIPGEPAHGGFLKVLAPDAARPFTPGHGRAELAQAIVDPANPLTARVLVNRVWQWHFGAGLVRTPSDFGLRGEAPTHPELLDWLAAQFIAQGWSLKQLHRQILLSATWQQSSADNPAARAADPDNRLLWRMNRHRLGFEELRDSLLAVAGRLDPKLGGPPVDLTKNNVRRRTVFGTVDRVTLPGFFRYFDFPGADAHVAERHETIVAQQALYLMNNGFVMEQAAHVARRSATANTHLCDSSCRAHGGLGLPLLPPGEERAGVRRAVGTGIPLSPTLSPLVPRGERETDALIVPASSAQTFATTNSSDSAARLDQLYRLILGRNPSAAERTLGLEFIQSQSALGASANVATNVATNPTPNIPEKALTKVATNAAPDLWRYGWGTYDEDRQRVTNFEPFPFVAGNQWKGGPLEVDPVLGRASLNARGGFAGPSSELATIRRWIVPRSAHLSITGQLSIQLNSTQPLGDGVRARIVSSRRGKLGEWIVHGTEEITEVNDVPVEQDDTIDFVVDARGRDQHANFTWAPVIRLDPSATHPNANEKLIWDAAKDFKAPATAKPERAFDPWDRLAHVLLEANEFMFLD